MTALAVKGLGKFGFILVSFSFDLAFSPSEEHQVKKVMDDEADFEFDFNVVVNSALY